MTAAPPPPPAPVPPAMPTKPQPSRRPRGVDRNVVWLIVLLFTAVVSAIGGWVAHSLALSSRDDKARVSATHIVKSEAASKTDPEWSHNRVDIPYAPAPEPPDSRDPPASPRDHPQTRLLQSGSPGLDQSSKPGVGSIVAPEAFVPQRPAPLEALKPLEPMAAPSPAPPTESSDDKTTKSEPRPSSLVLPAEAHLLFQEVEVYRIPKFVVQGLPLTQELHYRLLSELRVGRRQENGTREVRQTVYDTKLIKSDDLSKAAFAESLNGLLGKQFTFKLDENQEVFGFEGKDDRKALPVDKLGGRGFMVTSVMDQDGWKELATLTFFVPNEQFANGQPWKRRMMHDWGPLGSWYGETTYRRNAQQQTVHRIDYAHEMKYMPPAKDRRDLPFQISKADFKPQTAAGVIFFDTKQRRVASTQERFHVKGLISTTVLGQASQIQIEEQQQITIQIHDQNPWRQ